MNHILTVTSPPNTRATSQVDINTAFSKFDSTLYAAPLAENLETIHGFLDTLTLSKMRVEERTELGAPISATEIRGAIKALARNRACGSDGLPTEFCAPFVARLVPQLERLFKSSLDTGALPPTTAQALVASLLKPDKHPSDMSSYRPLSILNTEYKNLSKALACRLLLMLPKLLHNNQCGFVPYRKTVLQICRLHHIMDAVHGRFRLTGCISLDLRQAFDTLFKFIQFSILHRAYLTPHRLHIMFPAIPSICPCWRTPDANLLHMLWNCSNMTPYWVRITAILTDLTEQHHWPTLDCCILGLFPRPKNTRVTSRFVYTALLLAKRILTKHWKSHSGMWRNGASPKAMHYVMRNTGASRKNT